LTPRVPGLFNEASGLSSFSALTFIYAISKRKFARKFKFIPQYFFEGDYVIEEKKYFSLNNLLLLFSIIGLFVSFSNTGILMAFIFCFFMSLESLGNGLGKIKLKFLVIIFFISVLIIQSQTIDLLRDSFTSADRAAYTYETFSNINNSFDLNFFIGNEAVWAGASWDSLTRFIQMFGLLGSIPLWGTIYFLIFSRNFLFSLSTIPLFMTNAQFSMAHSIVVLGFFILFNFSKTEKFY